MVELVIRSYTPLQRSLISNMMVVNVHLRDVLTTLVKQEVQTINDFEWTKQLRCGECLFIYFIDSQVLI